VPPAKPSAPGLRCHRQVLRGQLPHLPRSAARRGYGRPRPRSMLPVALTAPEAGQREHRNGALVNPGTGCHHSFRRLLCTQARSCRPPHSPAIAGPPTSRRRARRDDGGARARCQVPGRDSSDSRYGRAWHARVRRPDLRPGRHGARDGLLGDQQRRPDGPREPDAARLARKRRQPGKRCRRTRPARSAATALALAAASANWPPAEVMSRYQ
jgi:hypothetical protein